MIRFPRRIPIDHRTITMVVACLAGFVASVAALLLAGFASNAARFAGVAPPHWQLVVITCSVFPLIGLAGLLSVQVAPRLRWALVWVGGLGAWALPVYDVAVSSPRHPHAIAQIAGGPLAGLTISAAVVAGAAAVLLVAGSCALRQRQLG